MENKLRRDFIWNTIGSIMNACTSLFFMITVTRINGVSEAGIFTFAFSTACLIQVVGTYAGRAYHVTNTDKSISELDFMFQRFMNCIFMIICMIGFLVIKDYAIHKSLVIILLVMFKMIEAYSETLYAIVQRNDELCKVGISLFIKGSVGLVCFVVIDFITKNMAYAIIGLIVVNLIMILFYDCNNIKGYEKTKFDIRKIKKLFISGFFVFVFTFLTQYVINAPKYAIDNFMSNDAQLIFGIIVMPATLIILCSQFLIQPFLLQLTNLLKADDLHEFRIRVCKISLLVFGIGIITVIGAYLFGIPCLEFVYGTSLEGSVNSLAIIIVGATFYGISYILSTAMVAMRKTFIQAIIYGTSAILALLVSNYLVNYYGVFGASLSYFITMLFLTLQYIIVFFIVSKKKSGS